uniref:Uncharacterized protein n=1 Tax=Attheya septentrionalis TaxID=420275 RepID=A0A7S2UCL0_9STRA|mmetsp:Transcript_17749/g.32099  ORF Transcript_17749/g.32099 Transcript_17749/m.32099 type:complete len:232 (+) Transcript_17749:269-964(+)
MLFITTAIPKAMRTAASLMSRRAASRQPFSPFLLGQSVVPRQQHLQRRCFSERGTNNNKKSRWKRFLSSGTPEIVIGTGLLALYVTDQCLQLIQASHRQDAFRQLQAAVDADETRNQKKQLNTITTIPNEEALFQCAVRRIPKLFDGTMSLMNVRPGDVVDVLEERCGPDGTYNLCRTIRPKNPTEDYSTTTTLSSSSLLQDSKPSANFDVSIGWFPISCLEKQATNDVSN